jgi:hypothetical protein
MSAGPGTSGGADRSGRQGNALVGVLAASLFLGPAIVWLLALATPALSQSAPDCAAVPTRPTPKPTPTPTPDPTPEPTPGPTPTPDPNPTPTPVPTPPPGGGGPGPGGPIPTPFPTPMPCIPWQQRDCSIIESCEFFNVASESDPWSSNFCEITETMTCTFQQMCGFEPVGNPYQTQASFRWRMECHSQADCY